MIALNPWGGQSGQENHMELGGKEQGSWTACEWHFVSGLRLGQRQENAFAIVNAGMSVKFEDNTNTVRELQMFFGSVCPTVLSASQTCRRLVGGYVMACLATWNVICVGQIICTVAAYTYAHAKEAAKKVKITYEDIEPRIITIEVV
ncbi:Hypothetical predicted protein [Marmota monax]|uniref:CO dehydrogenase flavoprotein C-terminal domain-containing protein n=1 Tax=Marmota monax TaxID=9995 RepID=A0A5E4BLW0_MARMO|nr:hypothetical protein GHT09_014494 [Marmota monax]VTJ70557.1 Hypothetical predicted protein [Marmota monax]